MSAELIAAVLLVALGVSLAGVFEWNLHVNYGPLIPGNRRWRREAPAREARRRHLAVIAYLTPADREWLTERGWAP